MKDIKVFQHLPLLNFQLITDKDSNLNPVSTELNIFIDTDEDDLNRTLGNYSLKNPHLYNFSLEFEGFQQFIDSSEDEKFISGSVYLNCQINALDNRHLIPNSDGVSNTRLYLASPKLRIFPLKKSTPKTPAVWLSPAEISAQIKSNWNDIFSSALSGYLVQNYNLFNAKSIAEVIKNNKEQYEVFSLGNDANNVLIANKKLTSESSPFLMAEILKKLLKNNSFALPLSIVLSTGVIGFILLKQPNQLPVVAQNNFSVPTNVMSLEEAKNAQLRELGINPDDLAADLGCFVDQK